MERRERRRQRGRPFLSGGLLAQRARQKLDFYSNDERLIQAARYAYTFHQDVIAVLDDENEEHMLIRLAAGQVHDRDERAREEQTRRSMKK